MTISLHPKSDRETIQPLRAPSGGCARFDTQDFAAYPFFSLVKNKRLTPIDFRAGAICIRIEAAPEYGIATIWDADILIWAANRIVTARDRGCPPARVIAAIPDEIITFVGRGKSPRDAQRLKAALNRLQSTSIATSFGRPNERKHHRFSWISGWKETVDASGRMLEIEIELPDWFLASVLDNGLDLTIYPEYFALWGGLERWLYRLLRKQRGFRENSWNFDLAYLHARSGSLTSLQQFAHELDEIVRHQKLPGYRLRLSRDARGAEQLLFASLPNERRTLSQRCLGEAHTPLPAFCAAPGDRP